MRKLSIHILLILGTLIPARAQDVKVSAAFDSTRIYIGDQIYFTISVEQPSGIRLTLPSFRDTLIKNIEIIRGPETDSVKLDNNRIRITEKYLVTSFDSGSYQVDPVFIEVKEPDGIKRFISDYSRLDVLKYRVAPADSTANFYDIIEPYRAPVTFREILPWALGAIALGALAWALVVFLRRYKKEKGGAEIIVNPDPAHVIAFRELEKLKSEELWQKGQYKPFYTRLTEILRQYLENRYRVYSLELTTSETLDALLKTGFKRDSEFDRLKNVLTAADLVKFAKYVPVNDENDVHFRNAWDFVDATKEVIIETSQPAVTEKEQEGAI